MRPKSKLYTQGDKALSDRVRTRNKARPKTDAERSIKKHMNQARQDTKRKMIFKNLADLPAPIKTEQQYFKDPGA